MSEEELRKKMEFIVEQQAQFTVGLQLMREAQEAEAKLWREKYNGLTEKYNGLTDAITTIVGLVGKLTEAQKEAAEASKQTDAKLAELAVKQAETDERLNIFISVVERYISERRNGRAPGGENDAPTPST